MTPDDPRHGTYAGSQKHLRDREPLCEPCRLSFRKYQRRASKEKNLGRVRRVPTPPVTAHIRALVDTGTTVPTIAQIAGVSRATIQDALTRPRPTMNKDNADAILGVTPHPQPHSYVNSTGTIRRIEALQRLGWSYRSICAEAHRIRGDKANITDSGIRQMMSGRWEVVRHVTKTDIAAAYDSLSMRLPEPSRHVTTIRMRAERKQWAGPLCWDDDTIDDPQTKPVGMVHTGRHSRARTLVDEVVVERAMTGEVLHLSRDEAREVARRLQAQGISNNEIQRRTGIVAYRVLRDEAS